MSDTKIYHINGILEIRGQHRVFPDYTLYEYLQFKDDDGNIRNIKKVKVGNTVDANLHNGTKGSFYLVSRKYGDWLFAFKGADRKIYDNDAVKKDKSSVNTSMIYLAIFSVIGAVIAFLGAPMVGLPIVLFFVGIALVMHMRENSINDINLTQYLDENKFNT